MTWRDLLHDLENEMAALEAADAAAEVADRTRGEIADTTLADRFAAQVGGDVLVTTADEVVRGRVVAVGPDWVLLAGVDARDVVVATRAVVSVRGLGRQALVPAATGAVAARTGLTVVLRRVARDRSGVLVRLVDATILRGVLTRVAADHVDLRAFDADADADAAAGSDRRTGRGQAATGQTVTVPLTAIRTVRQLDVS